MLITRRSLVPAALLTAAIVAFLGFFALTAEAQTGVTETPRTNTMQVIDGEVLDSVVVGNRVIVVGTFTQVRDAGGSAINQPYIAAYNATSGRFDGTFRPDVDDFINAIDASGSSVFVVGQFSNVDGNFTDASPRSMRTVRSIQRSKRTSGRPQTRSPSRTTRSISEGHLPSSTTPRERRSPRSM